MTENNIFWAIVWLLVSMPLGFAMGASSNPVVIELFESQGCSSCPPAERVMQTLQTEVGEGVILMTFHVDYWDSLGWKDTFSDPRWTERQKMYARQLAQDSIYTPEMVVQGRAGFVGSDLSRARSEVKRMNPTARQAVILKVSSDDSQLKFTVELPAALSAEIRELLLLRVETSEPVHVLRGENRGETMSGDHVVRDITSMPLPRSGSSRVQIPRPNDREANQWVVLAVNAQGAILAAQSIRVP